VADSLKASGVAGVEQQKKEEAESGQQERREERKIFFFINNLLGSIVATQAWNPKIRQLLWLVFFGFFFQIFPILGNRTT
jgi:uncharacterized membrane protein